MSKSYAQRSMMGESLHQHTPDLAYPEASYSWAQLGTRVSVKIL
jgi:hypothetical protein